MIWVPTPIYSMLPYLYIISGIIAMVQLDHPAGTCGSLMLMFTGMLVWKQRREKHYS